MTTMADLWQAPVKNRKCGAHVTINQRILWWNLCASPTVVCCCFFSYCIMFTNGRARLLKLNVVERFLRFLRNIGITSLVSYYINWINWGLEGYFSLYWYWCFARRSSSELLTKDRIHSDRHSERKTDIMILSFVDDSDEDLWSKHQYRCFGRQHTTFKKNYFLHPDVR